MKEKTPMDKLYLHHNNLNDENQQDDFLMNYSTLFESYKGSVCIDMIQHEYYKAILKEQKEKNKHNMTIYKRAYIVAKSQIDLHLFELNFKK